MIHVPLLHQSSCSVLQKWLVLAQWKVQEMGMDSGQTMGKRCGVAHAWAG